MSRPRFAFKAAGAALLLAVTPGWGSEAKPALPAEVKPAAAQPVETKALSLADAITKGVRSVMEKSGGAICRIEADDDRGRLEGTGFLIDPEGIVVTSYSLGQASEDLSVTVGDESYPAKLLVADGRSGIALLKIKADEPFPFLKTGSATALEVGAPLVALGYPLGLPLSPSFGVVAGFNAGFQGRYFATRHLRVNTSIQRGECGAPLLNLEGEAVGVLISSIDSGSGVFALPIEAVQKVLHDFRAYQRVRPGWLGADVRITDAPEAGSTARLRGLRSNGPGALAKLRPGDVLLQVGDWKISSPDDVLNASFYITAGEPLTVRISRAGKIHTLTVTPADPPEGATPKILRQEPIVVGQADQK